MTVSSSDRDLAMRFYARLVALYPATHRDKFGPQMRRTFEDAYLHATDGERRVGLGFWLAVLWDEGRSIIRERAAEPQGDTLFFAFIVMWTFGLLFVPVMPAVTDWHNLVFPTTLLVALMLVVPGISGLARRFATVVVTVAVVECMAAAAQSMNDQTHLVPPVLLLACMAFSIKTLEGLNARIVGIKDGVWSREELTYGVLAGLAGVIGLALGAADTNDGSLATPFFFGMVVPFLCGIAGFRSSRRNVSVRSGIYSTLGALLIGATIWILAIPVVVEGYLLTVIRDHPVPVATLLPYWQRPLSNFLFIAAVIGMVGAYFGYVMTPTSPPGEQARSPR